MNNAGTKTPIKPRPSPPRVAPVQPQQLPDQEPPYHVILYDDDEHTYEYVIEMLQGIFGYPLEKGFQLAKEVDKSGRVIVATVHKELAELRQEQIQEFGPDPRLPKCKGSMSASIEPAE
jgi:ATP-dependent Clp protease adaptor protein ClpS